ncbi:MAG: FtsX-like permease family protein [Bdellovibrionota bacterium]|nr:FtsX-like permease family protein [Bdellovibrionota bacterium]
MVFHFLKHYLFSKRSGAIVRSISRVSIFGIGISVAAMIIVLSVMNGLNESIHKRLLSIDPHLSVDLNSVEDAGVLKEKLIKIDPVFAQSEMFEITEEDVIFRTIDALFSGAIARGISPENFENVKKKIFVSGDDSYADIQLEKNEIAIGEDLARSLAIFEGDELTIIQPESLLLPADEIPQYLRLKVKFIFRSNVGDLDAKYMLYIRGRSFREFQESYSRKFALQIYLQDKDQMPLAEDLLKKEKLSYRTWKDKNSSYLYALKLEKIAMGSFLGLTILIASFTIMMVMSLLISQKKQDIALLKTLGMTNKETKDLFTKFGFQLGAFGVIGGLVIGLVLCFLIGTFELIQLPSEVYYDHFLPVKIDYFLSAAIAAVALVICYIGAVIPARAGAKQSMAQVLRPGGNE